MSTDYEPTKEQVEAMSMELRRAWHGYDQPIPPPPGDNWGRAARFVLRRQHEREAGLLEALRSIERMNYIGTPARVCSLALAAHAALDAPKVPTLLEAAQRIVNNASVDIVRFDLGTHITLNGWATAVEDMAALKAAVEREEKKG